MAGADRIDWLLDGDALQTRRRRAGADAQRGYDYQRAYAVLKIAEMLRSDSGIIAVRYEGAQDVDVKKCDGVEELVQLKNEPDETYPCSRIAPILVGFALDLLHCGRSPVTRFALVLRAAPGSPALQRLEQGKCSDRDERAYLAALLQEPELGRLGPVRVADLLADLLSRLRVDKGKGWSGDTPAFELAAERVLSQAGVAPEHLTALIREIERRLKGRPTILPSDIITWASAARRLPSRILMAPTLPRHYTARPAVLSKALTALRSRKRVALVGYGGAGKTILAQALAAERESETAYPDGVLWASLGQTPDLPSHLKGMLRMLGQPADEIRDLTALLAQFRSVVSKRSVLLVLDDIWDDTLLAGLGLPDGLGLVVTTRQPRIARRASLDAVDVDGMEMPEAVELIKAVRGRTVGIEERAAAERFVRRVSALPFAVHLGARLFDEGHSFDRVVVDLDDEEKRLSTLDADADDAIRATDRRSTSLEACIGLSVATLGERLRQALYRLAVLPEDESLEPEIAAAMFDVGDVGEAQAMLAALAARGLLTATSPAYLANYRVHDLVLDYARSGLGSRRQQVAEVPAGLPSSLPELHWSLVERCRLAGPAGRWSDMSPDFYWSERLDWHLERAGRQDLLAQVLREVDRGRAAWLGRQRRLQQTDAFLRLVARSLAHSRAVLAQADLPTGTISTALDDAFTAAFAGSMAMERARQIPLGLLEAMVRSGDMRFEEARGYAMCCNHTQRAWHLVGLLPLAEPAPRAAMFDTIRAELISEPFPGITDSDLLDRLLAELLPSEVELLESTTRATAAHWAELLSARFRTLRADDVDAIGELVEKCRRSEAAEVRANLVLFAASGVDVGESEIVLVQTATTSKRKSVKGALLAMMPAETLEPLLETAGVAVLVMDVWQKYPARHSPGSEQAIRRMIAVQRLSDPPRAAWLRARLLAASPEGSRLSPELVECERELLALPDADWHKFDGLGWLMATLPRLDRGRLVGPLAAAGAAGGFAAVGAVRFDAIARHLPRDGFLPVCEAAAGVGASIRAMAKASLLAHAPEDMWAELAMAVYNEASTSGAVGDLLGAIPHLPVEMLAALFAIVDRAPLSPELVHAVAAVSDRMPSPLVSEVTATWALLPPHARLRSAAASEEIAALYLSPSAILEDLALMLGLRPGAPWSPMNARDPAYANALTGKLDDEDFRATLAANPLILADLQDFNLATFVCAFGRGLSSDQRRTLIGRVRSLPVADRATPLGLLAVSAEREQARLAAVEALVEAGSPSAAAIWIVELAPLLGVAELDRLKLLRSPDPRADGAVMLEVALYPSLTVEEREMVETRCLSRMSLFPGFIDKLDRALYSERMCRWFDVHLLEAAQRRLKPNAEGANCLNDARLLSYVEPAIIAHLYALAPSEPTFAATFTAALLESGYRSGLDALCAVLERMGPFLRSAFEQAELRSMVTGIADTALAHARS